MSNNNNIIIELSNQNSQGQIANGDFETTFEPVVINNGDVIQLKNAFIDSVQQSYDQIYLPNDVSFSLTFGFYDMHNPICPDYSAYRSGPSYDYQFYVMLQFMPNEEDCYIKRRTFNGLIKSGLYTTASLTLEINRQLVQAFPGDQNPFFMECTDDDEVPYIFIKMNIDRYNPTNCYFDPNSFYYYNPLENITGDPQPAPGLYIGARQVALTFNDDDDNCFKWKFLHTPRYDDDGNTIVSFGGGNVTNFVTRDCGIFLMDMQPRTFWQGLGFNTDQMFPNFSSPNFRVNTDATNFSIVPNIIYFNHNQCTTEAMLSIDDFFGQTWQAAEAAEYARKIALDQEKISSTTRGISGSQFISFKKLCPFLMIEFLTNFNSTYLSGNEKSKFITAIVSRNYTTNNYITGYSDSSIVYQHSGESFILSSIRTRILDPDTKDIANDVGNNNYVIVQVIKNNNPQ